MADMFREFGDIESVFIPKTESGEHKDQGYVCFKKSEDAERACEAMNKKVLDNGQFLIVNRHVSKRENELKGDEKIS